MDELTCYNCDHKGRMFIGPCPCNTCTQNSRIPHNLTDNYKNESKTVPMKISCSHCHGAGTIEVEMPKLGFASPEHVKAPKDILDQK